MTLNARIERLEQVLAAERASELPVETLRAVRLFIVSDEVFVDLMRVAALVEDAPSGIRNPLLPLHDEVRAIVDRLEVKQLVATQAGQAKAAQQLRTAADERMRGALTNRFGTEIAAHFFQPN